ncbi:hypothetical protein J6590_053925 [Homalodisca vitripennis]|nr:hypothetical protein J6590_053925 [Homalodisca vitripennis]
MSHRESSERFNQGRARRDLRFCRLITTSGTELPRQQSVIDGQRFLGVALDHDCNGSPALAGQEKVLCPVLILHLKQSAIAVNDLDSSVQETGGESLADFPQYEAGSKAIS